MRAAPNTSDQVLELLSRRCRDLMLPLEVLIDSPFDLVDALQGLVPAPLQFVGHQTGFRVGRIVLLVRGKS